MNIFVCHKDKLYISLVKFHIFMRSFFLSVCDAFILFEPITYFRFWKTFEWSSTAGFENLFQKLILILNYEFNRLFLFRVFFCFSRQLVRSKNVFVGWFWIKESLDIYCHLFHLKAIIRCLVFSIKCNKN